MKFYITGSTRGLGQNLSKQFDCTSFDRPYDLSKDIDMIVEQIESNSVVILNAHADGTQIEYIKKLKDRCRLVVCGSIAAINFDPAMLTYSQQKTELEKFVTDLSLSTQYPILYLRLTSSSYRNHELISNTIRFWLDNPEFTFAGYNINE